MARLNTWLAICGLTVLGVNGHGTAQDLSWAIDFGDNPGALNMAYYAPATLPAGPRPVVVALHGCMMQARDYAATGWFEAADEFGFYVIFPEQRITNNPYSCFNWWTPSTLFDLPESQIGRDGREPRSIVQMVRHLASRFEVDDEQVFVTGVSAGAGMTAVLLATYPDVFAAGQIVAGVPYGCARTPTQALECMRGIEGTSYERTPAEWAALVQSVAPAGVAPPRVSVWHGAMDMVVAPDNGDAATQQWSAVHNVTAVDFSQNEANLRLFGESVQGRAVVLQRRFSRMQHAVPIIPPSCGQPGAFRQDIGVCAARYTVSFFGLDGRQPPRVTMALEGNSLRTQIASDDDVPIANARLSIDGVVVAEGTIPATVMLPAGARHAELIAVDALDLSSRASLDLEPDAGVPVDAGSLDGGGVTDGGSDGSQADADVPADGAMLPTDGGCACVAAAPNAGAPVVLVGFLMAFFLRHRRPRA